MSELDRLLDALLRADQIRNPYNRAFCIKVTRENIRIYVARYAEREDIRRAA